MKRFRAFAKRLAVLVVGVSIAAGTSSGSAEAPAIPKVATEPSSRASARAQALLGNLPLYFIENRGQEDPRVAYYVPGRNIAVYFTADGVTFAFSSPMPPTARRRLAHPAALPAEPVARERWALKLDFVGANPAVTPRGQEVTPTVISYFKGPESEWKTGLRTYARLIYPDLWPGIDLVYGGSAGRLKYTFLVKPGADPGQIKLAYRGASAVVLDRGRLEVSTPVGGFSDERPYAYQELDGRRTEVPTRFALAGGQHTYRFGLGDYDRSRPLVLDPSFLVYAGYIGGLGTDQANAIAVDSAGNAYVAGFTNSRVPSFPGTIGPDLTFNSSAGGFNAFVAKVKADGTGLVYAGYIGGLSNDVANAIAVDSAGNAYVAGFTTSDETIFPVKVGPDLHYNGTTPTPFDAFVAKVRADGTALVYAGYIGGKGNDLAYAIAVDLAGNAYVAGFTDSTETSFPVKVGPAVRSNGGAEAFVAKVKADGTGLVYAGFIGGNGNDVAHAIAVDSAGNAYVAGSTTSTQATFPVKVGPDLTFNSTHGEPDAFVAKVKADGTGLVYCGYIGGALADHANAIDVDAAGNAYVAGETFSDQTTFPVLVGPDLAFNGGGDAFVAKVKADGTALVYAGYIGGADRDVATSIAVDSSGNAYVAGSTGSDQTTFPVQVGPDLAFNGVQDAFVAKVKADGTGLLYAGYIGGASDEFATGIAVDSSGNAYLAGGTGSDQRTFPVTVGPDLIFNGDRDTFVVKLSGKPDLVETAVSNPPSFAMKPGQSFLVSDTTVNQGLGSALVSTTRYYLSADTARNAGDILLSGTRSVAALVPGATQSGSATVTIPSNTPLGVYSLLACADDVHAVAEVDESNNCIASANEVLVTLPDLRETFVSDPPATANAGGSFSVTDTVQNLGFVAAGPSTTRYYLSTDTARNGGDLLLTGSRAVGALPGRSFETGAPPSTGTISVTIPSATAAGTYHVLACADDLNVITEFTETNNCLSSTGTVTVTGVGTFELTPTEATVLPGELLLYRFIWISPTVWRDLATLQLRFVDQTDDRIIFEVLWDQAGNTFSLVDDHGHPVGRPVAPDSDEILQTGNAILHLDQTTVVGGGPTAPDVTLTLAMTFKSEAAGQGQRDYRVEVLGTNDVGQQQGFDQAGTLRVERTAAAGSSLAGSATAVGTGIDNASIHIQGQFTAATPIALEQAALTLTSLLDEVGGAGELTRSGGAAPLLPLTLGARAGSKPTAAIYETASGVRPGVRVEVKIRDPKTGLVEFSIKVDRATLPVPPALCGGGPPATAALRTGFGLQVGGGVPVLLDVTVPWRCLGTQLKTP